ncbi:MAG: Gfo/Idh/MocA family oxidoreductase, partial [bacterium]
VGFYIYIAERCICRKKIIGDVHRIEAHMAGWGQPGDWWRTSKSISGGILYDWGVHLLEYTLQIMQANIVEVSGFAKNGVWASKTRWKNDCNEDEGFAVVRFDTGAWATLTISAVDSHPKGGWLEFTGSKGTYIMDGGAWEIITHDGKNSISTKGPSPESTGWKLYQNIADHLTKGEKLIITPEWARRPIHILDLANRSAKLGRALPAKHK